MAKRQSHTTASGIPKEVRVITEHTVMVALFVFQITWHERMADPGCPQRHTLRFLSTLLSQKVPEKSDVVLRCMIAGNDP